MNSFDDNGFQLDDLDFDDIDKDYLPEPPPFSADSESFNQYLQDLKYIKNLIMLEKKCQAAKEKFEEQTRRFYEISNEALDIQVEWVKEGLPKEANSSFFKDALSECSDNIQHTEQMLASTEECLEEIEDLKTQFKNRNYDKRGY